MRTTTKFIISLAIMCSLMFLAVSEASDAEDTEYEDRVETFNRSVTVSDEFYRGVYYEYQAPKYYINNPGAVSITTNEASGYGLTASVVKVADWDVRLQIAGTPTKTGTFTVKTSYTYIDHYNYTYTVTVNSSGYVLEFHSGIYEMDLSNVTTAQKIGTVKVENEGTNNADHVVQIAVANGNFINLPKLTISDSTDFNGWYTAKVGGNLIGQGNSVFTPSSNGTYYAHFGTRTISIDLNDLFTMNHGEEFKAPAPITTTPAGANLEIRTENMSTQLEIINGYIQTKNYGKTGASKVTDEAGPHVFTIIASMDGYESVQKQYTVHIPIYSIQVQTQTIVEGQTAYLQMYFSPNLSDFSDLDTSLLNVTATWLKTDGSTQIFGGSQSILTSYGARIPINTVDTHSTETRYMSFTVKAEFTGKYADFGSYQPTQTYQLTLTPSSDVDPNVEPTISYFTVNPHPTMANYYVATASNPQNVHTYTWIWGDGYTEETTEPSCLHNYQDSNGKVILRLIVGNVNGKTNEYTQTVSLDSNGSYNAFVGKKWVSPQYHATADIQFLSGWPSTPVKHETTNSANVPTQFYTLDIPSTFPSGQDLAFTVTEGGQTKTYYVGIFDPSTIVISTDQIAVVESSGYSVKFGITMDLTKILYDSGDNRSILWTAYQNSSVNSTILGTSTETNPTFDFSGNHRDVTVRLTVIQQDKQTYNYYKTLAVPIGTNMDDGPSDESKKVSITAIADRNIEAGRSVAIELPYQNVNMIYCDKEMNGLTIVIDEDSFSTLTLYGTKAATYNVKLKVEFNDGTWGETSFNVRVTSSTGGETHEPVERQIVLERYAYSGAKGSSQIQITTEYTDVKELSWTPKNLDTLNVILREGGNGFDWIQVIPYKIGTFQITVELLFDNGDYGTVELTITGTEPTGHENEYGDAGIKDQNIESGMPVYIKLDKAKKVSKIIIDDDSDLKDITLQLAESGEQILYLEYVEDGKYHVKLKLFYKDDTQAQADFYITVGSYEEPVEYNWMMIGGIAVAILAVVAIAWVRL